MDEALRDDPPERDRRGGREAHGAREARLKTCRKPLLALCAALGFLAAPGRAPAEPAPKLTAQELRGKRIYHKGEGSRPEGIPVALAGSDDRWPAAQFTCASCHGADGEGRREGGLTTPPVTWSAVASPATSALTARARTAYDEAAFSRLLRTGLDPAGPRIHPAMPRYALSAAEAIDLAAYLRRIGGASDADPGVEQSSVRVGAALPLTGPLAEAGRDVRAALAAVFDEVNRQGGVYGRAIELVVASREPAAGRGTRVAVVHSDRAFDADALAGLRAQAALHGLRIVAEHGYRAGHFSAAAAAEQVSRARPAYVFAFGSAPEIEDLARQMDRSGSGAALLSSVAMAGRSALPFRSASPRGPGSRTLRRSRAKASSALFGAAMRTVGAKIQNVALQSVAYGAARVFVEAMKVAGNRPTRASLVAALEQVHDFHSGVVPPVTYGPNRRVGAVGSFVVRVDPGTRQQLAVTGWMVPAEALAARIGRAVRGPADLNVTLIDSILRVPVLNKQAPERPAGNAAPMTPVRPYLRRGTSNQGFPFVH